MIRALVIYCHPAPQGQTAAVRHRVLTPLAAAGDEVRLHDIYGERFDPVLTRAASEGYLDYPANTGPVEREVTDLRCSATADMDLRLLPVMAVGKSNCISGAPAR